MKTLCAHCIFNIREGSEQVGCQFNVLNGFKKTLSNSGNYELDGYCHLIRNIYWSDDLKITGDMDKCKAEVIREQRIEYEIFIWCDGTEEETRNTLESIKELPVPPKKIRGVFPATNQEVWTKISDGLTKEYTMSLVYSQTPWEHFKHFYKHLLSSPYIVIPTVGTRIDPNLLQVFNDSLLTVHNTKTFYINEQVAIVAKILLSPFIDKENPILELQKALNATKNNSSNS
jgi:hypothetical protein